MYEKYGETHKPPKPHYLDNSFIALHQGSLTLQGRAVPFSRSYIHGLIPHIHSDSAMYQVLLLAQKTGTNPLCLLSLHRNKECGAQTAFLNQ